MRQTQLMDSTCKESIFTSCPNHMKMGTIMMDNMSHLINIPLNGMIQIKFLKDYAVPQGAATAHPQNLIVK